jgi:hypothetical protein
VYEEEALGCSAVFRMHKRLAQRKNSLEDYEHTAQPKMVRTELMIPEVVTLVPASRPQMVLATKFCLMI